MKFEFDLGELEDIRATVKANSWWSIRGKKLLEKLDDYISQLEAVSELGEKGEE